MTNIKSYTDVEQSKKLAEVLPLESADYCWGIDYESRYMDFNSFPYTEPYNMYNNNEDFIPCWSLAALLGVLPKPKVYYSTDKTKRWYCECWDSDGNYITFIKADNPIDACYKMILKLHKLNLL